MSEVTQVSLRIDELRRLIVVLTRRVAALEARIAHEVSRGDAAPRHEAQLPLSEVSRGVRGSAGEAAQIDDHAQRK
jgi:hypothetical protein